MDQIKVVGIDLAKHVFQLHGVDQVGNAVLRRQVRRSQMDAFFTALPPCKIGIEACPSAHYWARRLISFGHDVRLMPPKYVKPFVKRSKNELRMRKRS